MKFKVSIHDHRDEFNALVTDLLGIGVKIDERNKQLYIFLFYVRLMR